MGTLEDARQACEARRWKTAVAGFCAADETQRLDADDLTLLAVAAQQCGEAEVSASSWQRAHRERLDQGDLRGAVRCAFWLGLFCMDRGDPIQGGAWIGRATEVAEQITNECPEHGLVRLAPALGALQGGDPKIALTLFSEAAEIGERCDDREVVALGRLGVGQAKVLAGDVDGGMRALDQAMVAVMAEEVSPVAAGIIYCATIEACQVVADIARARSWTHALTEWCDSQPDLVPFRGRCLVHRAEILQLDGHWGEAAAEARRACELLSDPPGQPPLGAAFYQLGEIQRLVGDADGAVDSFRRAGEFGREPQPGLALLRLASGDPAMADASLDRVLDERIFAEDRTRQLAARVQTALAVGDGSAASSAAEELSALAASSDIPFVDALAEVARGRVALSEGNPKAALADLRSAVAGFGELGAVYQVARAPGSAWPLRFGCSATSTPRTSSWGPVAARTTDSVQSLISHGWMPPTNRRSRSPETG